MTAVAVVPVRCALLADVEFLCVRFASGSVYLGNLQQLIAVLIQQTTRRLVTEAMRAFLNANPVITCGGDLRGVSCGPMMHMMYQHTGGNGHVSNYITVAGMAVLLDSLPFQMETGRWALETFLKESEIRMDALFGEVVVSSYAAAIQAPAQVVSVVEPTTPVVLLDLERTVNLLERLLKEVVTRTRTSHVRMDTAASVAFLDRSYCEQYALMVENCTVTRELAELKEKFQCLQEARERDIVRLVHLDGLTRKYRETFGDVDPSESAKHSMRLQALEARAMTAEAEVVVLKHELAQLKTLSRMWQGQVDFHKTLAEAETAKLEALRVSTTREIEQLAQWGVLVGDYQAHAEQAERDRVEAMGRVHELQRVLAARDAEIASLRAGPEAVLKSEYEAKVRQIEAEADAKVERARADMKRKIDDAKERKDEEYKRRLRLEGKLRKI